MNQKISEILSEIIKKNSTRLHDYLVLVHHSYLYINRILLGNILFNSTHFYFKCPSEISLPSHLSANILFNQKRSFSKT